MLRLLPKKETYVAKNFRSCKGCSQLSVDIFMASGDLLVAQKSYFLQKSLQKNPGYSKRSILGKKAQNRDIGPTHICSYRWHIWTIGSGGVDMMF